MFVKGISYSYIVIIISVIVGFISIPLLLDMLGAELFGVWILAQSVSGYINQFSFGVPSATGSQAECGESENILNEKTECNPISAFGLAKYSSMNACEQRCKALGLRFVWLRVLSVYGGYDRTSTMLYSLVNDLLKGNEFSLSSGNQYWDFLHSDDIANALFLLSKNKQSEGLYVIGEGSCKKLKSYIAIVANVFNIDSNDILGGDNSVVTYNLRCQTTRLNNDVGWIPEISFKDGISKFIEYVKYNECK